jgi:hypothetical protein
MMIMLKTCVRTFAEYIATSHDAGLTIGGEPEVDLFGFSDAAYLTKGDSLSRLAYCFFLNLTSGRKIQEETMDVESLNADAIGCICAPSFKDSIVAVVACY